MGERLQNQRTFACSFVNCESTFSKSWKLQAHLCKHTGLVSKMSWTPICFTPVKTAEHGDSGEKCCKISLRGSFGRSLGDGLCNYCRFLILTTQKPFSCETCEKSFCTRYQLTRHQLSHSGEKPFKWASRNFAFPVMTCSCVQWPSPFHNMRLLQLVMSCCE